MGHGDKHSALPPDEIAAFWTRQAQKHGLDPASSWLDRRAIELEINTISRYVEAGHSVLDVGCGTGYSTVRYAKPDGVRILGIDYVDRMVTLAEERRLALPAEIRSRLEFRTGDVRSLDGIPLDAYDRVLCTRVIINLGDVEAQRQAIRELGRRVRPGGLLLLSEATVQGWERLNALRREWGLPDIEMPAFNLYLDEHAIAEYAGDALALERVDNFASSYYVATRLLKPLLARTAGERVEVSDPEAEFNRWASLLPPAGDYGTQKLFILRRH